MKLKDAAFDGALRYAGKAMAADFESRADTLLKQIEEVRKLQDDAAAAERSRPHLPTTQTAIGTVAALAAKLAGSTPEERTVLRTSIVQQLRTAFAEIRFGRHAIVGLIELPEKPKSLRGFFGMPRPIDVRKTDGVERYFLRHVFFSDHSEELADLGGGKGIIHPRFA
jgi:hypothetical protein